MKKILLITVLALISTYSFAVSDEAITANFTIVHCKEDGGTVSRTGRMCVFPSTNAGSGTSAQKLEIKRGITSKLGVHNNTVRSNKR